MLGDTIVARASAQGSSERAVLRVSGPRALAVAGKVFAPLLAPVRAVVEGHVTVRRHQVPAMALVMPGPRSFTGEDVVELHVPGSALLVQHLLDCMAVLPDVRKSALAGRRLRIADVGSGAGLPGIPWAIAEPSWDIVTIEAVEKKAAFQRQVKIELRLANLEVLSQRVESLVPSAFNWVVSRAFASLSDFVTSSGHLVADGGRLLAMKGARPDSEIQALPAGWVVEDLRRIEVPGLEAQRHIVILRKS